MRTPTINGPQVLAERMIAKQQVDATIPEAAMPPYMEMFLAHLRLLIGVPFEYLVPDARLLPDESIRFFYVDRSWTDRLVDGALAVGKIGTREQAHHQAHAADVQSTLDLTERTVRNAQANRPLDPSTAGAGVVTGFLLRSAAVSGWPSMDVRAFSQVVAAPPTSGVAAMEAWLAGAAAVQLRTLRLELLSPSVLLALFDGTPELVWCEEPHQGLQFTVRPVFRALETLLLLDRRTVIGETEPGTAQVAVPVRAANSRVIAVQELRNRLNRLNDPQLVPQTGSAALAIECMSHPWRQRFQSVGASTSGAGGAFVPTYAVANRVADADLRGAVEALIP
jgi:hypothetical protein